MNAILSIRGLYEWDNTIFDDIIFPDGFDREIFVQYVLFNFAELECLYPSPWYFKSAAKAWAKARYQSWAKIWESLNKQYDPLEDYDRYTDFKEHDYTHGSNKADVTNKQTAFNSDDFKNTDGSKANSSADGNSNRFKVGAEHGTTGLLSKQYMLLRELELRKTSFCEIVAQEFMTQFCLMIY